MFRLHVKRLCKNPVLISAYVLYLIFSITFVIWQIRGMYAAFQRDTLFILRPTLKFSYFTFVFFLFFSYEYTFRIRSAHLLETLMTIKGGRKKYYFSSLLVMAIALAVYAVAFLFINALLCSYSTNNHPEYYIHIALNILVNLFLIPLIAVVIGGVFTFIKHRIVGYLLMVLLVFFSSPAASFLLSLLAFGNARIQSALSAIFRFFDLFPPSLDSTPIHAFGYSLLPYRFDLIATWLLAGIALLLLALSSRRDRLMAGIGVLAVALSFLSIFLYVQPSSKLIFDLSHPADSFQQDATYYQTYEQHNQTANFSITSYDLELDIGRELSAIATLQISDPDLLAYDFTLYHGYKVEHVQTTVGHALSFIQDGDRLTVENPDAEQLNQIILFYKGSAPAFYTTIQGVFLPGYFPYYPHSGFSPVYNTDLQPNGFNRFLTAEPVSFRVQINSGQAIYSNLDQSEHNVFEGVSDGLTLVSGFYDSRMVDGITMVYPYLSPEYTTDSIDSAVKHGISAGTIQPNIQTIIIIPPVVKTVYEEIAEFSDHLTIDSFMTLDEFYEEQKINPTKVALYRAVQNYKSSEEGFYIWVEALQMDEIDKDAFAESSFILLAESLNLTELSERFETEDVISAVEQYIQDDSDLRSIGAFFDDLNQQLMEP